MKSIMAVWATLVLLKIWWTWQVVLPTPNCPLRATQATATKTSLRVLSVPCQTQSSSGCRPHPQINLASSSSIIAPCFLPSCLPFLSPPCHTSQCHCCEHRLRVCPCPYIYGIRAIEIDLGKKFKTLDLQYKWYILFILTTSNCICNDVQKIVLNLQLLLWGRVCVCVQNEHECERAWRLVCAYVGWQQNDDDFRVLNIILK